MRIGIDCRAYGSTHGYMGKYIEHFISYLIENTDTNEYVLFFNDREFGEFLVESPRFRAIKTSAKIGSISEQILLPYELYREKLDLVLFSHPSVPFFYLGKTIIILSDLVSYFYPEKHLKGSWMRLLQTAILRQSIRKSRSVITLSEVLKHDIIEIFDTPEEKIQVIPPVYPDSTLKTKASRENEVKQFFLKEHISERYILSVWDLREYKNIPRLLQTYSLLLKEDGMDIDLVLVWKEDSSYHEIRSNLIQLGLQSRVHIYNMLEEDTMGLLFENASLYILPSLYEGSEASILAPLAYGLPIVSSLLPSITAVLGKNEAAFFRPMSIPDMHEAMKKALENPSRNQSGRDMSVFSLSSVGEKILSVFSLYNGKIPIWAMSPAEEKANL